jgi:hypothetical protein
MIMHNLEVLALCWYLLFLRSICFPDARANLNKSEFFLKSMFYRSIKVYPESALIDIPLSGENLTLNVNIVQQDLEIKSSFE